MINRFNAFLLFACFWAGFAVAMEVAADEKSKLWEDLGLIYAEKNDYHENFGNYDLLAYEETIGRNLRETLEKHLRAYKSQSPKKSNGDPILNQPFRMPLRSRLFSSCSNLSTALSDYHCHDVVFEPIRSANRIDGVEIRRAEKIDGYGAFATKKFEADEIIGEYTGQIFYQENEAHKKSSFIYYVKEEDIDAIMYQTGAKDDYLCNLIGQHPIFFAFPDKKGIVNTSPCPLVIDALRYRNEMAFINHSQRFQNARSIIALKVIFSERSNEIDIVSVEFARYIVADKVIEKGTEILWNYNYAESVYSFKKIFDLRPEKACYHCDSSANGLEECSGCQVALYCGKDCFIGDRESHKKFCKTNTCWKCNEHAKGGSDLLRCAECRVALYCSRDCQGKDWPAHKKLCRKTNALQR